jgi:hypothetical protein
MTQRHAIDLALDFARMPALARTPVSPPIPHDIIEVMRIAAASPKACQDAAAATGEPIPTLIDAARFYLQQSLLRPEADCHRVLGLQPGAPRATARSHMRLLLQWLHPDRNSDLDAVYAERVLRAWREVSNGHGEPPGSVAQRREMNGQISQFRLPWIKRPITRPGARTRRIFRMAVLWAVPGLSLLLLSLWSASYFLGLAQSGASASVP